MTPGQRLDAARAQLERPAPPVPGQLVVPTGPRIGSLCTGYGGLDAAVQEVFGGTVAWVADLDPGPRKILAHHWPDTPNLGDLTAVDWAAVEPVDILTGGYPCQPFSVAGLRKGTEDDRHIWPYLKTAVRVLRPRLCLFENVAGHVRLGLADVLADLAEIGFDAEWATVRASDVGGAHQRERLFILAWPADAQGVGRGEGRTEPTWEPWGPGAPSGGGTVANPGREGLQGRRTDGTASDGRHNVADADRRRLAEQPQRDRASDRPEADNEHGQLHPVRRRVSDADAAHDGRERGGAAR